MVPTQLLEFLSRLPIFADLEPGELKEMAWLVRPFRCPAERALFGQGDHAEEMFLIESGRLGLTIRLLDQQVIELGDRSAPAIVGEMALVDGGPRSATVRALEPVSGYTVSRRAFDILCADFRPGAFKVVRSLSRILNDSLTMMTAAVKERQFGSSSGTIGSRPRNDTVGNEADRLEGYRSSADSLDRDNLNVLPIFDDLKPAELLELVGRMNRVDVARGKIVVRQGDDSRSCFITVRGAVEIRIERGDSIERLALAGPGKLFGGQGLIDSHPRSADCVARENSILLELTRRQYEALVASNSSVAFKFLNKLTRLLSQSLRDANRRLTHVIARDR